MSPATEVIEVEGAVVSQAAVEEQSLSAQSVLSSASLSTLSAQAVSVQERAHSVNPPAPSQYLVQEPLAPEGQLLVPYSVLVETVRLHTVGLVSVVSEELHVLVEVLQLL